MKEVIIKTIDELIQKINSFENHYIFRGQSCSKWGLSSGLERILNSSCDTDIFTKAENYSLTQFKSKFHIYDDNNSRPKSKLQWLSLMQHYGIPTRLLDFTESPYIALYFAIETFDYFSNNDIALFAIDYRALLKASIEYIKIKDTKFDYDYLKVLNNQDEIFDNVLNRFSYDILWISEPKESNIRLDRQAGCFLMSGNLNSTISSLIDSPIYKDVEMVKFIIPHSIIENIYALLKKTNTTSKGLYGDVLGLSLSIKMDLKFYTI